MRLGNVAGVPALVEDGEWLDVRAASGGQFGDTHAIFADWERFAEWAHGAGDLPRAALGDTRLGPPIPTPRQVFGAGLNYRSHLAESGRPIPELPQFFTKFPTCLVGPNDDIVVSTAMVDYEVELVVVIGRATDRVPAERAWDHVAGLMVGQDISARNVQRAGQLSMGKSFRTFGPTGPYMSTLDEVADPGELQLRCALDGRALQDFTTSDMVFNVPELIAALSAVTTLLPGDLVFTGTGAGVGIFRDPPVFLTPGAVLESSITQLGQLRNVCVADSHATDIRRVWRDLAPAQ